VGAASDTVRVDRLIELGLNRYGAGDLDGAILMWEEALAIDADNVRATSYLAYVKDNYDLLTSSEPSLAPGDDAFGIEEEPEYQIEILPGELAPAEARASVEQLDSGWFEEATDEDGDGRSSQPLLELDAEPPPLPPTIEAREPDEDDTETEPGAEISFEDRTQEYQSARQAGTVPALGRSGTASSVPASAPLMPPKPSDFQDTGTGEFQSEETTGGFRHEATPLGFASELTEVRKRDLGFVQPIGDDDATNALPRDKAAEITGEKTFERNAFSFEATEDDLLATKPRLRPRTPVSQADIETQDIPVLREKVTKREMPEPRPPASPSSPPRRDSAELSQAEVMLTAQKTRKLDIDMGAPTRDLGLRPKSSELSDPHDEELPTRQSDARAIREAQASFDDRPETRQDIVLAFDPINARSEQIIEEIDKDAPPDEQIDDQTRRRIGALLDHALKWSQAGDVDRAVAAVDLALSEDPNSVLAQKLITRNRDTIMTIFQSFVGDMERQPQLSKPLHELQNAPISPRAAFLLSRVDGTLTVDELLDVSGMPRMEAYRYLCQLFLRGILR